MLSEHDDSLMQKYLDGSRSLRPSCGRPSAGPPWPWTSSPYSTGLVPEQGRPPAARRRRRLPAVPGRGPSGRRAPPRTGPRRRGRPRTRRRSRPWSSRPPATPSWATWPTSGSIPARPSSARRSSLDEGRGGEALPPARNARQQAQGDQGGRAGDIAAMGSTKNISTGDTLCLKSHPIVLESIRFPSRSSRPRSSPRRKPTTPSSRRPWPSSCARTRPQGRPGPHDRADPAPGHGRAPSGDRHGPDGA